MSTELPRFPTLKGNPELVAMNQWLERLLLVVREAQVEVAKIVQYHSKLGGLTEDDHLQYLRTDGTRGLTENWDAGLYKISSLIMEVQALTGEAPFIVDSTTQVDNLNVEYLQGKTPADIVEDAKKYAGFENRTDSSIAMSGDNFQITTATSYNVYIFGVGKKTVNATLSVEITEDQNITYVYLDWSGTAVRINKSASAWDIKDGSNIPLAIVFKDGAIYAVTDERHGYNRNLEWHNWAHNTIGAMYYSGLGGIFTNTTLSVDGGTIYDEDIRFVIAPKTECRLWYRNGATPGGMRTIAPSTTPYRDTNADGTGILQYDDDSGILQSVGTGKYSAQWVYASNDATYPIYVVIGQTVGNLAAIRNSTAPIINLSTAEWKLLYRVIYRNASSTVTWIETADFRSVQTGVPTNFNPTNHSSLTGRDAVDSHPISAITDGLSTTHLTDFTHADIAHANRASLDLVSGTNTGDQDLSSYLQDITGESITDLLDIPVPTDTGFLKYDGLLSVYLWEMVSGGGGLYGEVDGGVASSVYTLDQNIDGGIA